MQNRNFLEVLNILSIEASMDYYTVFVDDGLDEYMNYFISPQKAKEFFEKYMVLCEKYYFHAILYKNRGFEKTKLDEVKWNV